MLEFFKAWKRASDVRRLNTDAPIILEHARQTLHPERMPEIAKATNEHLKRCHKIFEPTPVGLKRAILEYKRLHQEARRQRDDVLLTAFTLVQIHIRAEDMGDDCQAALDTIDGFLAEWGHGPTVDTD